MDSPDVNISTINFILNAIQTGGLVSALVLAVMAFARSWIYPAKTVDELKVHIEQLTQSLNGATEGMKQMAAAWEERNKLERETEIQRMTWDRRQREHRD